MAGGVCFVGTCFGGCFVGFDQHVLSCVVCLFGLCRFCFVGFGGCLFALVLSLCGFLLLYCGYSLLLRFVVGVCRLVGFGDCCFPVFPFICWCWLFLYFGWCLWFVVVFVLHFIFFDLCFCWAPQLTAVSGQGHCIRILPSRVVRDQSEVSIGLGI